MGVYQVLANGNHTLVASGANDVTAFGTTAGQDGTLRTFPLSASFTTTPGTLYGIAFLFVGASTGPVIASRSFNSSFGLRYAAGTMRGDPLAAYMNSQTDLPTSIAPAALATSGVQYWIEAAV